MDDVLSDLTERFVRASLPEPDDVAADLDAYDREQSDVPTVGREVGQCLRLLTEIAGAKRVFEFGSGFGYSAYWFASALPDDGEIVLTEFDESNLETAREFLTRAGLAGKATFEQGDALEAVERHDGPLDVVLFDLQKKKYPDALAAVRDKLAPGALLVADNAMKAGPLDTEGILAVLEGETPALDASSRGIADYLTTVRDDPEFETMVVPLGQGLSVSRWRPET